LFVSFDHSPSESDRARQIDDACESRQLDEVGYSQALAVGVLRILPFRQGVRGDGRLDVSAATRLAMK
jgi:hypothetical protein